MSLLATEILNRWMLGWPKRVKVLLDAGELMPLLISQEVQEREVYSEPGNRHLAWHEMAELYGLSAAPPLSTSGSKNTKDFVNTLRSSATDPADSAPKSSASSPSQRRQLWKQKAAADFKRVQTADLSKVKVW